MAKRWQDSHKGDFGKVLIIGGSRGMLGAPALMANAAFRCGAGLVRMAVPVGIYQNTAILSPCSTNYPLAEDENGFVSPHAVDVLLSLIEENDTIAIGPGLGRSEGLQILIEKLVSDVHKPLVVDADGLNNLAAIAHQDFKLSGRTILTPHPGEMKRLWQTWFEDPLPAEREEQAVRLSQTTGAIVVLKGAGTLITDGSSVFLNETGNPGMATGGTGDVLSGCIAGLAARQDEPLSPLHAAILAVYIHGMAGDFASESLTETAVIASDLIEALPDAWQDYESEMFDMFDGIEEI